MKIAIVHDDLLRRGGAEQVAACFHIAFPEASIYTLAYNPEATYEIFRECEIRTSFFQKISTSERVMKALFFPVGIWAMRLLDVTDYDVVLMSSTFCAKYVKISPNALVINYCHTPFRLAWNPDSYQQYQNSRGLKKIAYNSVINIIKNIDYKAAKRTNLFLTNAKEVKQRIVDFYKADEKKISIISPPVNCNSFYISENPKTYFLVVSRFEFYKKVDLVIQVFNKLEYPLIIVGKGSMEALLKGLANDNIIFKKGLQASELAELYANCKALIFPQHEDYGITPLEANSSGRPVIAYNQGGVLETMVPYQGINNKQYTAVFFDQQSEESLLSALDTFFSIEFDPIYIRKHSEKFDTKIFINKIKKYVEMRYNEFIEL